MYRFLWGSVYMYIDEMMTKKGRFLKISCVSYAGRAFAHFNLCCSVAMGHEQRYHTSPRSCLTKYDIAQLVELQDVYLKVAGSMPLCTTYFFQQTSLVGIHLYSLRTTIIMTERNESVYWFETRLYSLDSL